MLRERILHPPPARFSLACLPLKGGGKLLLPRMKFTSPSMGEVGAKRRAGVISESLKGGIKRKSHDQAARRDTDEHGWFECFAKQL